MPRTAPEKPDQLARSAFEVFADRGFRDATVDEIAAKAGVTKGSFYSHYRSKREVILAACNYYYQTYQQAIHAEMAMESDSMARFRAVLKRSVCSCIVDRQSRAFTTQVFGLALRDEAVRASWAQFYDTVRQMYVGLVRAAAAAGFLKVDSPDAILTAVNLMLAAIEGVKLRAVFEPRIGAPDEQNSIVEGLLAIFKPVKRNRKAKDS